MVLTQREKYIAMLVGALLAVVIVFGSLIHYVSARHDIAADIDTQNTEKKRIQSIFDEQYRLQREFKQMVADGLKNNQAEAKGQIRDSLELWAQPSGINEKTLNDVQVVHDSDFDQMSFKLSGWGTMATIAKMLNQCETTTLPLRVTKIVINPVKESEDYLYLELTVSTISQSEKSTRTRASAGGIMPRGEQL